MDWCSFGAHFGRSARAGDAVSFSQPAPDAVCRRFSAFQSLFLLTDAVRLTLSFPSDVS